MMKQRTILVPILVSIVPLALIVLNVVDIFNVYEGKGDYPFGSEFFGKYSIYSSRNTYIGYNALFTLLLALTIILAFRAKWKVFFVVLLLDIILFCYPLITNI
jgi:hypothetical protein